MARQGQKVKTRKKEKKIHTSGRMYVKTTFNNTLIAFTDGNGNMLCWSSAGAMGFKGSRKSTPFAAGEAAEEAARKVKDNHGMKSVDVFIIGPGPGRESACRALKPIGIMISSIEDVSGIPHNGCRKKKKRRV